MKEYVGLKHYEKAREIKQRKIIKRKGKEFQIGKVGIV